MRIEPLNDTIGASVSDISPDDLTKAEVAGVLLDALERHGVLAFKGLHISDEQHVAFSRHLGEVEILPVPRLEYPEIFTVSLDPDKALSAEYLKGTFHWHIDGATDDIPNKATMLNALEVSATGGETQFCNTYAAWEALPDDRKSPLSGVEGAPQLRGCAMARSPRSQRRSSRVLGAATSQSSTTGLDPSLWPYLVGARRDRLACDRHGPR